MRAAILQPMYLPWVGYFGFIHQADVFVFYDDVQFLRDSWQRRNRIKVPAESGGEKWLTVPIAKDKGQRIIDVEINNAVDWHNEHWSLIRQAYGREPIPFGDECAAHFEVFADDIESFYSREWKHLSNLNTEIIESVCDILELGETEILYSSDLNIEGAGTERLVKILQYIGADEYVNGPSGKDYLDINQFEENGIALYWHEFDHPVYEQPYGEFKSHMSVIDFLFNVGHEAPQLLREAEKGCLVHEPNT